MNQPSCLNKQLYVTIFYKLVTIFLFLLEKLMFSIIKKGKETILLAQNYNIYLEDINNCSIAPEF